MGFRILVLHALPSFEAAFRSSSDYVKCYERYAPEHDYVYASVLEPVTSVLRQFDFDVVIMDSTALGTFRMRPRGYLRDHIKKWSFLKTWEAVKVGFPQDDYHDSATLDAIFSDWHFDKIYTVMPDRFDAIYPKTSKRAELQTVLTGYVDDNSVDEFVRFRKPFSERRVDLGQRVTRYPAIGGRYAALKGQLAEQAAALARERNFAVDVSTSDDARISGNAWFEFLGNTKFVTGAEGGVSVWDNDGRIRDGIADFLAERPDASFEQIEECCFPNEDGKHVFSAISPRLFESALMGCCQILLEGKYVEGLAPFTHYIPVKQDFSDLVDAVDLMRDVDGAKKRIAACDELLVASKKFRFSALVESVFVDLERLVVQKNRTLSALPQLETLKAAHVRELTDLKSKISGRPYDNKMLNALYLGRKLVPASLRAKLIKILQYR